MVLPIDKMTSEERLDFAFKHLKFAADGIADIKEGRAHFSSIVSPTWEGFRKTLEGVLASERRVATQPPAADGKLREALETLRPDDMLNPIGDLLTPENLMLWANEGNLNTPKDFVEWAKIGKGFSSRATQQPDYFYDAWEDVIATAVAVMWARCSASVQPASGGE